MRPELKTKILVLNKPVKVNSNLGYGRVDLDTFEKI